MVAVTAAETSVSALIDVDAATDGTGNLFAPVLLLKDTLAAFLGVEMADEGNL